MKIESNQPAPQPSSVPKPNTKAVDPPRTDAASEPADRSSISALGEQLLQSSESRVRELKRLFEAGEYSVSPEHIAASLIREHHKP